MSDVEKRIAELERKMNHIDANFRIFRDVLVKIQNENVMLRKNRDFFLKQQKEMLKKFPIEKDKLVKDIETRFVNPIKNEFREDVDLIKKITSLEKENKKDSKTDDRGISTSPLDELFVMVMNSDGVRLKDAAKHFNVHEYQVEEWAKVLEDHGLVEFTNNGSSKEIRKVAYK